MIDAFIDALQAFPRGLVFVAEGLIVLALAKLVRDVVTRYSVNEEVAQKANLAVALRLSGYLLAIILILLGVLYQPLTGGGWASYADLEAAGGFGFDRDLGEEVLRVFLYSLGGIVALNLVRILFDRLILYKFQLEKEVVEDRNAGSRSRRVRNVRRHRPAYRRSGGGRHRRQRVGDGAGCAGLFRYGPRPAGGVRPVLRAHHLFQHPR